jgi:ribosomal protein L11 methylase PrmA
MKISASFRDPSGFLFTREGKLFRQVNKVYQPHYDKLMTSGLYKKLIDKGLLISHKETKEKPAETSLSYKVIQPEKVAFISYPYEWSFSQYKDAALATLEIERLAMEVGLTLKDASVYNIQFHQGKPVLIDTLSFEIYTEGQPWVAYRQFCQHFLAPLALMALVDIRLEQLMRVFIDGIPLDLASQLLPGKTHFNLGVELHIHKHAASQKKYADKGTQIQVKEVKIGKMAFLGLIDNLESTVKGFDWKAAGTEWADYYDATNYTKEAFELKKSLVGKFIEAAKPSLVWDLGANTGIFSQQASQKGIFTVSSDIDPSAVEKNYLDCKVRKEKNILPLVLDLSNPSAGIGWANTERSSFTERGPADLVMALALVHHISISNNVPFSQLAEYLGSIGKHLIIEFVPKEDSQVQRLLASRLDIFDRYNEKCFEEDFSKYFKLVKKEKVAGSKRTLYLFKKK